MCLIGFLYRVHPDYPILLASNRDEFYQRPTARADWWQDVPNLLGGRDLEAGGTWIAIHRDGRFGCITNYRDLRIPLKERAPSRGELIPNFLKGQQSAETYLSDLDQRAGDYNGFNLLIWDGQSLCHYSNEERKINHVEPGVHALSNHLLDTPWPKVTQLTADLKSLYADNQIDDPEQLFRKLQNVGQAPPDELPDTGVPPAWERTLSAMFIESETYGTRVSSVLQIRQDGQVYFEERAFVPSGEARIFEWYVPSITS